MDNEKLQQLIKDGESLKVNLKTTPATEIEKWVERVIQGLDYEDELHGMFTDIVGRYKNIGDIELVDFEKLLEIVEKYDPLVYF